MKPTRREWLGGVALGLSGAVIGSGASGGEAGVSVQNGGGEAKRALEPVRIAGAGEKVVPVAIQAPSGGPVWRAAERLRDLADRELSLRLELVGRSASAAARVVAICPPWDDAAIALAGAAGLGVGADGKISGLASAPERLRVQGFVAGRTSDSGGLRMVLAAESAEGLRNALVTLGDRLYRDGGGHVVADPFDGVHCPAFQARHLKTDAMNCGPFRSRLEYWDPTSAGGVDAFADWLAGFRITDYDLLAFVRGWGASYRSGRFPILSDPQHPNVQHEFYPRLIDRLHSWGIRVWASDLYIASGYSMETGAAPEILSSCADRTRLPAYKAGAGSFAEILGNPNVIVCFSNPKARAFYADVVTDLLDHYPQLDGLNYHVGHTFWDKICRCPQCRDWDGNRRGVYQCFAGAYEAGVAKRPDIRMTAAVKMFGDATRKIVEHYREFPRLEFFCWLRWSGNLAIEHVDAPMSFGHEDGGGGLEANHDPKKTLTMIRDYFRDFEPWIRTYAEVTRWAGLPSISWEPALQREIEQMYFAYSQFTWERELSWGELARRFVIRSERRLDARLIEAYRLAMEANAALTSWGLAPHVKGLAQDVIQTPGLMETRFVKDRVAGLGEALRAMGLGDDAAAAPPVAFDLRRSLLKTWRRMSAGQTLGLWH